MTKASEEALNMAPVRIVISGDGASCTGRTFVQSRKPDAISRAGNTYSIAKNSYFVKKYLKIFTRIFVQKVSDWVFSTTIGVSSTFSSSTR